MTSSDPPPIDRLLKIMATLRGPDGCPWDKEQTHQSLIRYLIEEAHEAVEAIWSGDPARLRDELGDVLLQVVFHAQVAGEAGHFDFHQVAQAICDKLVRRHPHVFGDQSAETPAEVRVTWQAIKAAEGKGTVGGLLADVGRHLPGLLQAQQLQGRAATVGFDWPTARGALEKLREETDELAHEMEVEDAGAVAEEAGDMLFAAVNVLRKLGLSAEEAMLAANRKFQDRFQAMEAAAATEGRPLEERSLDEQEVLWQATKKSRPR